MGEDTKRTISLPGMSGETLTRVRVAAAYEGVSVSEWIRRAIDRALDEVPEDAGLAALAGRWGEMGDRSREALGWAAEAMAAYDSRKQQ